MKFFNSQKRKNMRKAMSLKVVSFSTMFFLFSFYLVYALPNEAKNKIEFSYSTQINYTLVNTNSSINWGNFFYGDYDMPVIKSFAYNHTIPSKNYCDSLFSSVKQMNYTNLAKTNESNTFVGDQKVNGTLLLSDGARTTALGGVTFEIIVNDTLSTNWLRMYNINYSTSLPFMACTSNGACTWKLWNTATNMVGQIEYTNPGAQTGIALYNSSGTAGGLSGRTDIHQIKGGGLGIGATVGTGVPSDTLQIYDGKVNVLGNLSIGTTALNAPVTISADTGDLSLWVSKNISATGYITRTSVYDVSKGSALDKIHSSEYYLTSEGKINHSAFGDNLIKYTVRDESRPVITSEKSTECITADNAEQVCKEITISKTDYPFTKIEEGVILDGEVALLKQAVYELKQKINEHEFCISKLCVGVR